MSRNRILYHPQYVAGFAKALREARADLADLSFKHACAQADLRRELDVLRAELDELRKLRAVRLAVEHAEAEVAELRRAREIARCAAVERNGQPLH